MTKQEMVLLLSHHPKIGGQTIKRLFSYFSDAVAIEKAPERELSRAVSEKFAKLVVEARQKINLSEIVEAISKNNIGYITIFDKLFPTRLKEIPDCPAVLFVRGDARALSAVSIAVVGSRKYTIYGARVARKFSGELAQNGVCVVSGLALGIDAIAHQAVVDAGGITVGVLGCGLDRIYPTSNHSLALSIIENGGAIISEYPPGTEPFKSNFPARNRIIAGLAVGTLVVEAARESGALITAMAALEYNRGVYAVPGPIDSESSEGTNLLIRQGAVLTTKYEDIATDLNLNLKKTEQKVREYIPNSEEEKTIIGIISDKSYCADDILKECDLNVAVLTYTLTMLEMKGILENVGGNWKRKL